MELPNGLVVIGPHLRECMPDNSRSIPNVERRLRQACAEVAESVRRNAENAAAEVLSRYPEIASDDEAAIEILYAEYTALDESGRRPDTEKWLSRFPNQRIRLERLIKLHDFLSESGTAESDTIRPQPSQISSFVGDGLAKPNESVRPGVSNDFGNYELIEEIGRGGMGIVYRARQKGLGRIVAVKVIQSLASKGDDHRRFQREAEAVASLDHPNIVRVHEVGKQGDRPFLSMEYVDGGALDSHIHRRSWSNHEIAALTKSLADAMHYAHQQGIIHRDLKPANILLTDNDIPKIVDFGLAKREDDRANFQTQSGVLLGTPCYMSPEQASGAGKSVGPTTDVFSLGVILYELMTKRLPFHGATPAVTLDLIANHEPVRPSRIEKYVSRDLETICLKCLNKQPGHRYASAALLSDDLNRFLDHRPISARRSSIFERIRRLVARHPQVSALVAAMLFVCIGSVAIFVWQQRRMDYIDRQRNVYEARQRERASEAEYAYESSLKRARDLVGRWTQFGLKLDNEPGMDHVRRRAFEDAVAYYEEFLSKDTKDPVIRLEAAQASVRAAFIHSELGLWTEAEKGLRRADAWLSQLVPDENVRWQRSDCLIQLAHILRRLERWSDSESMYLQSIAIIEELVERAPTNSVFLLRMANAKINLCVVYGAQKRLDDCFDTYLDALRIDLNATQLRAGESDAIAPLNGATTPLNERVVAEVAKCSRLRAHLMEKGKAKLVYLARENYLAELALCLDDLGYLLQNKMMLEPAERCVREAIELRELTVSNAAENRRIEQYLSRSETHLGVILLATGREKEAESWLESSNLRFAKLSSDFPERHECRNEWGNNLVNLASCYLRNNRLEDAIKIAAQAVSIQEQLVASLPEVESLKQELISGLHVLARAMHASRDFNGATKQYKRALEISPDNPATANTCAWTIITSVEVTPVDAALALQLAKKATEKAPTNANYRNTLALAYYRMSQFPEADRAIDLAMEKGNGGSTLDWFFKAMINAKLQKLEEANGWFQQAEARRMTESPASRELRLFSQEAARAISESKL